MIWGDADNNRWALNSRENVTQVSNEFERTDIKHKPSDNIVRSNTENGFWKDKRQYAMRIQHAQRLFYEQIICLETISNSSFKIHAEHFDFRLGEITSPWRIAENNIKLLRKGLRKCIADCDSFPYNHRRQLRSQKSNIDSGQIDAYRINILAVKISTCNASNT